jgi:hypothetical protein
MTQRLNAPSGAARQYRNDQVTVAADTPALRYNPPVARTLPAGVVALGVAGYLGVLGAFWVFFGDNREAAQSLAVVSFFALVFAGIPYVMFRTRARHGAGPDRRETTSAFLSGDFDTRTGPVSGWSALIQYAFLPVALAFGALAIGIVLKFVD